MFLPYYENPNYLVYDNGQVFSLYSNKFIKQSKDKQGYCLVRIKIHGKTAVRRVHRMVALMFVKNPNNLPQVNHKDEDKNNNSVDNLEWVTVQQNCNYGTRNRRISQAMLGKPSHCYSGADNSKSKPIAQYNVDGSLIATYPNCRIACETVCPDSPHMRKAINAAALGRRKTAAGFVWRFI